MKSPKKLIILTIIAVMVTSASIVYGGIICEPCNVGSCSCAITDCESGLSRIYTSSDCSSGLIVGPPFLDSEITWSPSETGTYYIRVFCDSGQELVCTPIDVSASSGTTNTSTTTTITQTTIDDTTIDLNLIGLIPSLNSIRTSLVLIQNDVDDVADYLQDSGDSRYQKYTDISNDLSDAIDELDSAVKGIIAAPTSARTKESVVDSLQLVKNIIRGIKNKL